MRRERHPAESLQQDFDRAIDFFEAKLLHRPPQASPPPPQPTASRASNGSEEAVVAGVQAGVQAGGEAGGGAAQGGLAFARCWNACISQMREADLLRC